MNAIQRRYHPYAVDIKAPPSASLEAAAASAAYIVVVQIYPLHKPTLDAALAKSLAGTRNGQARSDGIVVGRSVAEKMLQLQPVHIASAQR